MAGCNCNNSLKFDGVSTSYRRILWIVIFINVVMFLVEMAAGFVADSVALQADALDFLGDSVTYTITLIAIGHSPAWRASAAMMKGITLAIMGCWVLGSTLYRVLVIGMPNEFVMGYVAAIAFTANAVSALLLLKYRNGDANVRSVWLCSRNDAIGNVAVMVAAVAVHATHTQWPDLIVALLMALLFLHSATLIIRQAIGELRTNATSISSSPPCQQDNR